MWSPVSTEKQYRDFLGPDNKTITRRELPPLASWRSIRAAIGYPQVALADSGTTAIGQPLIGQSSSAATCCQNIQENRMIDASMLLFVLFAIVATTVAIRWAERKI